MIIYSVIHNYNIEIDNIIQLCYLILKLVSILSINIAIDTDRDRDNTRN